MVNWLKCFWYLYWWLGGDKIQWEQYLQNTTHSATALMFIPVQAICFALTAGNQKKFGNYTRIGLCIKRTCSWWNIRICNAVSWREFTDVGRCRRFFRNIANHKAYLTYRDNFIFFFLHIFLINILNCHAFERIGRWQVL